MLTEQVDSASIHSLISGLVRKDRVGWTDWERTAIAEVTLGLLFRKNFTIPTPPKPGRCSPPNPVDYIYTTLRSFVADLGASRAERAKALKSLKLWVATSKPTVKARYDAFRKDRNCEPLVRWAVGHDWLYHVGRLSSLIDEPYLDDIAAILDWSPSEKKSVKEKSKQLDLVEFWSEKCREEGDLPPEEILAGFLLSSLLRGRYYYELAKRSDAAFVWHRFRNFSIDPVGKVTEFTPSTESLVELYLAGLICRGAMEESSEAEVIQTWAENIRRLRVRTLQVPRRSEHKAALDCAVQVAKTCDLRFRSRAISRVVDSTVEFFVLPILGIASGLVAYAGTGSHEASLAAHGTGELLARPCAAFLAERLKRKYSHSGFYIEKTAGEGVRRLFALGKGDVKGH